LRLTSALDVLHYDEGAHSDGRTADPIYTAQLVAHKPLRAGLSA
jgi:hypothetical protein